MGLDYKNWKDGSTSADVGTILNDSTESVAINHDGNATTPEIYTNYVNSHVEVKLDTDTNIRYNYLVDGIQNVVYEEGRPLENNWADYLTQYSADWLIFYGSAMPSTYSDNYAPWLLRLIEHVKNKEFYPNDFTLQNEVGDLPENIVTSALGTQPQPEFKKTQDGVSVYSTGSYVENVLPEPFWLNKYNNSKDNNPNQ